jgi:hypothetical protein
MIQIKKFSEDIDVDSDILLYHGSAHKLSSFFPGILFLTEDIFEAIEFGKGSHILGQYGRVSWAYTVAAREGKIYKADDLIDAFITEMDHPLLNDEDYMKDLDVVLENKIAPMLRKQGYRYFTFSHPSNIDNDDIIVWVSLFPGKDLEIFDADKV